jgi:ADP-heptose:LPS heptosyltransferase
MSVSERISESVKSFTRFLCKTLFDREVKRGLNGDVKNILLINWNGMLGDATISSCFISALKSQTNIKIHVITTELLSDIYLHSYRVDSVYVIKKNFNFIELYKAAKFFGFCDTVIPLIGRMQWRDILFAGIINPSNYLSIDDSLKMSNFQLGKEVEELSIDEFFRTLVSKLVSNINSDYPYTIPSQNATVDDTNFILFNSFASRVDKSLTVSRSVSLLKYLTTLMPERIIYILYSPATYLIANEIVNLVSDINVKLAFNVIDINKAIAYIRSAEYVISVDTSIVHMAYGLNKKIVAIFPLVKSFNPWLPPKNSNIEFVFSKAKILNGMKNMNEFENIEIKYALNRLSNNVNFSDGKSIFFYYNKPFSEMPVFHRLNIMNVVSKANGGEFRVILINLDWTSDEYVENFIELPMYFHHIKDKVVDVLSVNGNQSDIVRLRLLAQHGGAYFDTSTIFLKNCLSEITLYNKLLSPEATLAGYSNVTFIRRNSDGSYYFEEGKDGIELGLIYAIKDSSLLKIINREIDKYWHWKTLAKFYTDYPPFLKANLQKISFLNEYHIHYSIYHLVLTTRPDLHKHIVTQSIHMKDKENSIKNGPNTLTDMFCRGNSAYESGRPDKLLECFKDGLVRKFDGTITTLADRAKIVEDMELISIPGYMRKELETEFTTDADYLDKQSLYSYMFKQRTSSYSKK